ncbi:xanthine dehydrogenase small subunit [Hydrogenophaga sp. 5NK40-0174]|uniref:xanthine dehydrogenase small subunit n=1 Tax=Hydrogenophaga sp. 5NK40-0174 TaxID=3127649 RepID=UPI00310A8820
MIAAYVMPGLWRYADNMNPSLHPMPTVPITIVRQGQCISLDNVPPHRTLLQVLREDLGVTSVKEGCAEGDCGACTVVVTDLDDQGQPRRKAINSCISLAHAAHGKAVSTASDIAPSGELHPAQQAMLDHHGSQCGFCTPGFVMSMYALYHDTDGGQGVTREQAQTTLSGNLCRCTGYRPILDAAVDMHRHAPAEIITQAEAADVAAIRRLKTRKAPQKKSSGLSTPSYQRPARLEALLKARQAQPKAQLVAGCTDVGLWITKQHQHFEQIIDVTGAKELQGIETYPHHIAVGAGVSLENAFQTMAVERPELRTFFERFAGLPVRQAGTLCGNVANGSPIGDSMPLLIALRASVVLMRWNARQQRVEHREMAIEDLYTGYRQNVLRADEIIAWVKVPRPTQDGTQVRAYKVSKRFDDDISAVCLAVQWRVQDGVVVDASIGAGGVAATPSRARQTEAALKGQRWSEATIEQAQKVIRAEFDPISDMRATANYRSKLLGNLVKRLWLETRHPNTVIGLGSVGAAVIQEESQQ